MSLEELLCDQAALAMPYDDYPGTVPQTVNLVNESWR
jgi:hypothetical protein